MAMQIAYEEMFAKLSMALARLAKQQQREAKRRMEMLAQQDHQEGPTDIKSKLRRRAFGGPPPTRS